MHINIYVLGLEGMTRFKEGQYDTHTLFQGWFQILCIGTEVCKFSSSQLQPKAKTIPAIACYLPLTVVATLSIAFVLARLQIRISSVYQPQATIN